MPNCFRITVARFEKLRELTVELFPLAKEFAETYFERPKSTPRLNKSGNKLKQGNVQQNKKRRNSGPSGSFYNKYKFWRSQYRKTGLLTSHDPEDDADDEPMDVDADISKA